MTDFYDNIDDYDYLDEVNNDIEFDDEIVDYDEYAEVQRLLKECGLE